MKKRPIVKQFTLFFLLFVVIPMQAGVGDFFCISDIRNRATTQLSALLSYASQIGQDNAPSARVTIGFFGGLFAGGIFAWWQVDSQWRLRFNRYQIVIKDEKENVFFERFELKKQKKEFEKESEEHYREKREWEKEKANQEKASEKLKIDMEQKIEKAEEKQQQAVQAILINNKKNEDVLKQKKNDYLGYINLANYMLVCEKVTVQKQAKSLNESSTLLDRFQEKSAREQSLLEERNRLLMAENKQLEKRMALSSIGHKRSNSDSSLHNAFRGQSQQLALDY